MITIRQTQLGILAAVLLVGGCSPSRPKPAPSPPAPSSTEANPSRDLGAGTPGAPCATSRLGKHFTQGGVTYTCKGPKPYRWRS